MRYSVGSEFTASLLGLAVRALENSWDLYGSFRKLGVPFWGVLIIRILLFRVLYWCPLFSETPI